MRVRESSRYAGTGNNEPQIVTSTSARKRWQMRNDEGLLAVFWDMDGTLIDSEPYWHESELVIARDNGGYWDMDLAWKGSGRPVPQIAREMIELGCTLSADEIGKQMIEFVAAKEREHMPWIAGVERVLADLRDAGVPNVLVTTSPREMAENLIAQAPANSFATYVCGDDDTEKKPSPAPYLLAAERAGIPRDRIRQCIAFEDSPSGLASAYASGMLTLAQTICRKGGESNDPKYRTVHGYDGVTAESLNALLTQTK